jgi:4'-phosphopantetheinyl transferase
MSQTMDIADAEFSIDAPLALADDEVQVWRLDLEAIRADESHWREVLSPDEWTRTSRFHFAVDRRRFAASRGWLRKILAGYLSADPRSLSFAYSKKEKPSLGPAHASSGITFNVSHSGEVALLAFARRREIGVDVEQVRRDFDVEAIAKRFFSAHEQQQLAAFADENKFEAFFRCWTLKEAYVKATGEGLSLPLHQFDVSLAGNDCDALLSCRPDDSETLRWSLREISAGAGYAAAVCVCGRDWHLKDWPCEAPH